MAGSHILQVTSVLLSTVLLSTVLLSTILLSTVLLSTVLPAGPTWLQPRGHVETPRRPAGELSVPSWALSLQMEKAVTLGTL